jgi:hypothetical protein
MILQINVSASYALLIFVLCRFFAQLWITFSSSFSQEHLEYFLSFTSRLPENPNVSFMKVSNLGYSVTLVVE